MPHRELQGFPRPGSARFQRAVLAEVAHGTETSNSLSLARQMILLANQDRERERALPPALGGSWDHARYRSRS